MNILATIILGIIPETLYFYLMIKNIAEVKECKIVLFLTVAFSYIISTYILGHNLYGYILLFFLLYIINKFYREMVVTDIFLFIFLELYLFIIGWLCILMPNYLIGYILNRILLFTPLLFKKYLIKGYKMYKLMWNRDDSKHYPVKSLTLRNISIIIMNSLIVLAYFSIKIMY